MNNSMQHWVPPVAAAMPFRLLFSGAALYSCVTLFVWVASWTGVINLGLPITWHIQEIVYGFAMAVVVGFLLTAAQTWTQVPTIKGWPLIGLVSLWLLGRLTSITFIGVSALFDTLFIGISALVLLRMILIAKNWRNLIFVILLLMVALLRLTSALTDNLGLWVAAVWFVLQFVMVVGGRVIPFFTARALSTAQAKPTQLIEYMAVVASILFIAIYVAIHALHYQPSFYWLQAAAALVATIHLIRWARWQQLAIYKVPLLWSLHLSYLCMIIGFMLLAIGLPQSAAIHMLAVGGIGGMILAMMSRVSLGHTGRPLAVGKLVSVSFALILLGALVRASASTIPAYTMHLLIAALTLWCTAYLIFLLNYLPILLGPRTDGRPE